MKSRLPSSNFDFLFLEEKFIEFFRIFSYFYARKHYFATLFYFWLNLIL